MRLENLFIYLMLVACFEIFIQYIYKKSLHTVYAVKSL